MSTAHRIDSSRGHRIGRWALTAAALGTSLVACGSDDEATTPAGDIATVVYDFHGATVAPEYYRSYSLTITPTEATLVVSGASEVLHEETQAVDDALWTSTRDAALELADTPDVTTAGCTGGTSDELTVTDAAGTDVVHVFVDHCGAATVTTDLAEVVGGALALFDLDTLLA